MEDGGGAVWCKEEESCVVGKTWCLRGERHGRENMLNPGQVGQRKDIGVVASGGITYCERIGVGG